MAGLYQRHKKRRRASNKSTLSSNNTLDTSPTLQATSTSIDTSIPFNNHSVANQELSYDMTGQGFTCQTPTFTSSDSGSIEECSTVANSEKTIEDIAVDTEQTEMPFMPDATSPAVFATFYSMSLPHTTQGPHATEDFRVPTHGSHLHPTPDLTHPLLNDNKTSSTGISYDDGPPSASMPSYSSTNSNPTVNNHHLDLNQDLPADYPNTTSTQFNTWLYTTSNDLLSFSEWALKKNNWECERYERL